jgi:pimeloyl-ACP methyl ester carboxylesterase
VRRLEHLHEAGMFVRRAPGSTEARPVLWVHGLGESGLCFERVVSRPELAPWPHLVPDLPGYGRSPWPAEPLGLDEHADHLAAWLGGRDKGPVQVVGHSMGGVVGLLLAERHPGLVRTLVCVDGNISSGDCTFSGRVAGQDRAEFAASGFDRLRDAIAGAGADDVALRGYHVSLCLADPVVFHRNSCELVELSGSGALARRLARVGIPVAYIAGLPGGACQESLDQLAAAAVPTSVVEPSGHWPFLDRPADFCGILVRLLATGEDSE